jgi:hypothetical protein
MLPKLSSLGRPPVIAQGRVLVVAIEALDTIEPSDQHEPALRRPLLEADKRRLRGIVNAAPAWLS